ncbi:MAG TPA: Sec-independent protein translocase protein TatB [Caulobacteraceae bacterium]|nr:Sec-independent protein translocase protein TatB [Caulobacteraceae bacterium]
MLPEIGATELLVIAAVALIVVGPKDLPLMMRKMGQFVSRMRAMASEFRTSFEDMARQSELEELRKEVEAMRKARYFDPVGLTAQEIADAEADQVFADIHEGLRAPLAPAPKVQLAADPEPQALPAPKPKRKAPAKKPASDAAPKKPRAPRKKPETGA